jgi:hypothetical protein
VRTLFTFAGAYVPSLAAGELAWEAESGGRLVGGVLAERQGTAGMVHGPVVVEPPGGSEALDVADQLVAALLTEAERAGLDTLYARPQGLDRIWVRSGLVPVPETLMPESLRGRPGSGLHAWRRPGSYAVPLPDPEAGRRRGPR